MAKITTGYTFGITKQQLQVAELLAEGVKPNEIARICFDIRAEDGVSVDEAKEAKARAKVRRWMRDPKVQEAYRALLREFIVPEFARAAAKLASQIDDPNGWLANKAANDIITRFDAAVMGAEDREITVKVEGMPKMGTPDEAE